MAALTLLEAAKIHSGEELRSIIIELWAKSSTILRAIPFVTIPGNALTYNREQALPGIAFRGVNEGYTPTVGVVNPATERLAIAGGEIDVDTFITQTMGEDQRAIQEQMQIKALAHAMADCIVNGDSSSNDKEFDGLKVRLTNNQLLTAGSTSGGDALSLLKLDELIDLVTDPTHLIMNKTMRRLLSAAARNTSVGGFITWTEDEFGKQMASYNNLPILVSEQDEAGNEILPFTEAAPTGGQLQTTSIYCTSFQEGMCQGIQNGDMDVTDLGILQTAPKFRTRVEWFIGLALLHGRSAARLRGIKNAAVTA